MKAEPSPPASDHPGFLEHVGDALIAPRRLATRARHGADLRGLRALLILIALSLVAAHLPALVRQAWFLAEVNPQGGLLSLLNLVVGTALVPLLAALLGSLLLGWLTRGGVGRTRGLNLSALYAVPLVLAQALVTVLRDLGALAAAPWIGDVLLGAGASWTLLSVLLAARELTNGSDRVWRRHWNLWQGARRALARGKQPTSNKASDLKGKPVDGRTVGQLSNEVRRGGGTEAGAELAAPLVVGPGPWRAGAAGTLALLLLLCFNLYRTVAGLEALRPVGPGRIAPAFSLPTTTGARVDLEGLRSRVVLVSFWATWCAPCVRELPVLARLQRNLGARGLTVLAVNVEGDAAGARTFIAGRNLGILRVPLDDGQVAGRYGVQTLPHLALIDRQGRVRRVWVGIAAEGELKREVLAALDAGGV